jgi:hypothetical protein
MAASTPWASQHSLFLGTRRQEHLVVSAVSEFGLCEAVEDLMSSVISAMFVGVQIS